MTTKNNRAPTKGRKKPAKKEPHPLKGKFFLTWEKDTIHWQGRVIDVLGGQLYSWIFGEDSDQFILPLEQTTWNETTKTGWSFYNSSEELRYRYDRYDEQRRMRQKTGEYSEVPKTVSTGNGQ